MGDSTRKSEDTETPYQVDTTPLSSIVAYNAHFFRGFYDARTLVNPNLPPPLTRTQMSPDVRTVEQAYRRGYNLAIAWVIVKEGGNVLSGRKKGDWKKWVDGVWKQRV